jgi:hypothetical protein
MWDILNLTGARDGYVSGVRALKIDAPGIDVMLYGEI